MQNQVQENVILNPKSKLANMFKLCAGVLILLIVAVLIFFFYPRTPIDPNTDSDVFGMQPKTYTFDPLNATYDVEGKSITLVNGAAIVDAGPGSSSKTTTRYFGNEAYGDIDGDDDNDAAFLITQDSGGTGLFYYVVVALRTPTGYKLTNTFFVGDRISPQSTEIKEDSKELHVNFAERKKGEPMSAEPSVGAVLLLKVTPEGVLEGLMK